MCCSSSAVAHAEAIDIAERIPNIVETFELEEGLMDNL